jgi:ATP-dependent Clp protease ATP-binding subunit ClpX
MTTENKLNHCSFCGNHKDVVKKLIVGDDVAICSDCIDLCNTLIADDKVDESTTQSGVNDPILVKQYLDDHVIGQDNAKMILSVAITNHYKRINNPPKDLEIQKGNVLLLGPTGSGKTLLAKTVAKYLNVPFVVADATSLTEAGYVGDDVESMISMLLNAANGDAKLAERGIVFIDEIDKIARKSESTSITRDVSGEGVQQALLKLVEGTTCRVPSTGGRKHPSGDMVEISTKNILFIAGGAFVGLGEIVESRLRGTNMGFGAEVKSKLEYDLSNVTPDDLTKFGMIPELIGRFTTVVNLDKLTKEDLVQVLTQVKNNYIDQYKYLFSLDDIQLVIDKTAIDEIVEKCLKLKTGARGLHTEIERALLPHMFNIRKYAEKNIGQINISREEILNPKPFI